MTTIKKIDINAFRGIRELSLDLDGQSLLLLGENGTGKSSIVDAIEFFFKGELEYINGVKSLSPKKHIPHVDFKSKDVEIEFVFNPGTISLKRTFDYAPEPPEEFKDYFDIVENGIFILRRNKILEFINSRPQQRFNSVGSIMGLDSFLDEIELNLKRCKEYYEAKVDSTKNKIPTLLKNISEIIGEEVNDVTNVLNILNQKLIKSNLPPLESLDNVEEHAQEMLKSVKKAKKMDEMWIIKDILKLTEKKWIENSFIEEINKLNINIKELSENNIKLKISSINLLETGQDIMKKSETDECPLCQTPINNEDLIKNIETRLLKLNKLSSEASDIRKESLLKIDKIKLIIQMLKDIISKIGSFKDEFEAEEKVLLDISIFLEKTSEEIKTASDFKNLISIDDLVNKNNLMKTTLNSISNKCNLLLEDIKLSNEEINLINNIRMIETASKEVEEICKVNKNLKDFEKCCILSETIYNTFSETKKSKIQSIYNSIQKNVEKYYVTIHPGEPHRNIELIVDPSKRASTEIKMESFGLSGQDPRALTSEGHLDTLGLCIFLAFVKKFNEDCSIIVLDDIITTIDSKHRRKIGQLILEELNDKQLIITTHDTIWYEQLHSMQRTLHIENNFKNKRIIKWDIEEGIELRPFISQWDKIPKKLNSGDKIGAGNLARQYLEWILTNICEKTNAKVVYKPYGAKYTVGELFEPAKNRLVSLIKEEQIKNQMEDAFEKVQITSLVGNLLSHNNVDAQNLSSEEVKEFYESVQKLHDTVICPNCKKFLIYNKDSHILRCRCLHPREIETRRSR